jgi:hypothetical protein
MSRFLSTLAANGVMISGMVYVPMPACERWGLNGLLEPLRSACANLVVDQLLTLIVLLEHRKEPHDVRILQTKEVLSNSKTQVGRTSKAGGVMSVHLCRIDHPSRQNRGQGCVGGHHKVVEPQYHYRPRARQREGFYQSPSTLPQGG